MTSQETVQALMDSIQRGDFDRAKTLISDDFRFQGDGPQIDQRQDLAENEHKPQAGFHRPEL